MHGEFTLLVLVFGIGILIFVIGNLPQLRKIPLYRILIAGFIAFFMSWVFTVLEGLFWYRFFNLIRHVCLLTGSILVAVWCWETFVKKEP